MEFLRTDWILIILFVFNLILLISVILTNTKINKINKNYKKFMEKLGDGKTIDEDLENYLNRVINLEDETRNIVSYCKSIDGEIKKCIQKIGIVRYNAFKDTGSDLSFAVAMLDEQNDGVVFNGIYSREASNIYAKPIEKGRSTYTITEEEKEAISRAINGDGIRKIR